MKNNQKGFVVPLLIAIIALLVIGGGAYVFQNKKVEAPTPIDNTETQQTNTQTPTISTQTNNSIALNSDWKTYTNSQYSYEVQYPFDLNYSVPTNGESSVIFNNATQTIGGSRSYKILVEEMSGTTVINGLIKQEINLSPKDKISAALNERRCNFGNSEISWILINTRGTEGIEATTQSGNSCLQKYLPWAAFKKDNKIYYLEFIKGSKEEFSQILSTFKFTE